MYEHNDLKENIIDIVDWMRSTEFADCTEKEIGSTHQAYGIIAERQARLKICMKACDTDVSNTLKLIAEDPSRFVSAVSGLYNSAVETAAASLMLARDAKHIVDDMIDGYKTPLDEYIESMDAEKDENFEETEESED